MIHQEGQKEVLLAYCNVLSCFLSTFCQEAEKNMSLSQNTRYPEWIWNLECPQHKTGVLKLYNILLGGMIYDMIQAQISLYLLPY